MSSASLRSPSRFGCQERIGRPFSNQPPAAVAVPCPLRHRRATTTNCYAQLDDAMLSEAAERVPQAIGQKLQKTVRVVAVALFNIGWMKHDREQTSPDWQEVHRDMRPPRRAAISDSPRHLGNDARGSPRDDDRMHGPPVRTTGRIARRPANGESIADCSRQ